MIFRYAFCFKWAYVTVVGCFNILLMNESENVGYWTVVWRKNQKLVCYRVNDKHMLGEWLFKIFLSNCLLNMFKLKNKPNMLAFMHRITCFFFFFYFKVAHLRGTLISILWERYLSTFMGTIITRLRLFPTKFSMHFYNFSVQILFGWPKPLRGYFPRRPHAKNKSKIK